MYHDIRLIFGDVLFEQLEPVGLACPGFKFGSALLVDVSDCKHISKPEPTKTGYFLGFFWDLFHMFESRDKNHGNWPHWQSA